jgi:hypothetical protein
MTIETRTYGGEEYTYEGLFNLSGPDLVKLHNKLNPNGATKRFGDKQAGVKRVWAVLGGERAEATPKPEKPKAEPKAPKAAKPKVDRKKREMRFVYPPLDEIREVKRGNSHRATLLKMMSRPQGATFAQLQAATWGRHEDMTEEVQRKTTYEGIRLCHTYVGYGLRQYYSNDPHTKDQCPEGTPEGAIYLIGPGNRRVPPISFDKE